MKASALFLTALLAVPGVALAAENDGVAKHVVKHPIHKVETKAKLDYTATGSVRNPAQVDNATRETRKDVRRLGMEASPYMMPVIH